MRLFFRVDNPETLSDEDWVENVKQLQWLADKKLLGPQMIGKEEVL